MRKQIKLRKKLFLLEEPRRQNILNQLEQIENSLIKSHTNERNLSERRAVARIKDDSKYFFKYARSKSINKTNIGPFIIEGKLIHQPK